MQRARDRVGWSVMAVVLLSLMSVGVAETPGSSFADLDLCQVVEIATGVCVVCDWKDSTATRLCFGLADFGNSLSVATDENASVQGSAPGPSTIGIRLISGNTTHGLELEISLPGAEPARLEIFDVMGRRVAEQRVASMAASIQRVTLNRGRLGSGVYWARVRQGTRTARIQIVLLR